MEIIKLQKATQTNMSPCRHDESSRNADAEICVDVISTTQYGPTSPGKCGGSLWGLDIPSNEHLIGQIKAAHRSPLAPPLTISHPVRGRRGTLNHLRGNGPGVT